MGKGLDKIRGHKLTFKQERFCYEYLIDQNAAAAARRAGYKWDKEGLRMLERYPCVKEKIEQLRKEQLERLQMSADEALVRIAQIARFDVRKMFDEMGNLKLPRDWTDEMAASIHSVDVEEKKQVERMDDEDEIRNEMVQIRKVRAHRQLDALLLIARKHNLFEREAQTTGSAIGRELAEIVRRAQESSEGTAALIGAKKPKVITT